MGAGVRRRQIRPTMSGELRHIGNIEQLVGGVDGSGTPNTTYVLWAENIPFAIDDWKSPEVYKAQQVEGQQSTRIRIRYRPGVIAGMRVVYNTNPGQSPSIFEYYEITGVTRDITLRVEIQLNCIKRDAAGFRAGATP
jgi:head-tail adaptor